jgi:acetyltransferase-like isoleucine patch superfamily enzyme
MMSKIKGVLTNCLYTQFKRKFKSVGENLSVVDYRRSYFSFESITLGKNVFINSGAWFSGDISIKNNVIFGPGVTMIGGDHLFGIVGFSVRFLVPKNDENMRNIVIEDEVWVGANVTINKGVIIGIGCVIGSASVVTKSIPPFTVAFGNPCRPVKKVFDDIDLKRHLQILGYNRLEITSIIERRNNELEKNFSNQIKVYKNPFV